MWAETSSSSRCPNACVLADAAKAITGLGDAEPSVEQDSGRIALRVGGRGSEALVEAVRRLDSAGIASDGMSLHRPSLDDVFLALTGHAAEAEAPPQKRRRRRQQEPEGSQR